MSDLIRKQEVIDIMYEVFGKYSVANDKQDVLGGFGLEMFRRVKELPAAYDKDNVVEELEEFMDEAKQFNASGMVTDMIEVVRKGGVE